MKVNNVSYKVLNDKVYGKVVIIGDLHNYSGKKAMELAEEIKKLKPGLVLVVGDNMQGPKYRDSKYLDELRYFLDSLSEQCAVVITRGNHDLVGADEESLKGFMSLESMCVIPLENDYVEFDHSRVVGVNPGRKGYAPSEQKHGGALLDFLKTWEKNESKLQTNPEKLNILMCHNPFNYYQGVCTSFQDGLDIDPDKKYRLIKLSKQLVAFDLVASAHLHDGYHLSDKISENPEEYMDKGYWEMPVTKNINGKIIKVNPLVYEPVDFCRGTIFVGSGPEKVIELQDGKYFYIAGPKAKPLQLDEDEAYITIKAGQLTPMTITGGVNKHFGLPIDKPEVTSVELVKKLK